MQDDILVEIAVFHYTGLTLISKITFTAISLYPTGKHEIICFFFSSFSDYIQRDLDSLVATWNTHTLQSKPGETLRRKKPTVLYNLPQLYGAEDRLCYVDSNEIVICEQETTPKPRTPCDDTVRELCYIFMTESHVSKPDDTAEARQLYIELRRKMLTALEE